MYAAAETGLLSCSCRSNPRPADSLTRTQLPCWGARYRHRLPMHHACNIPRWVGARPASDPTTDGLLVGASLHGILPVTLIDTCIRILEHKVETSLHFNLSSYEHKPHVLLGPDTRNFVRLGSCREAENIVSPYQITRCGKNAGRQYTLIRVHSGIASFTIRHGRIS